MTIDDVSRRSSLTAASISRIENKKQKASPDSAARLAKILEISEQEILYPERFTKAA